MEAGARRHYTARMDELGLGFGVWLLFLVVFGFAALVLRLASTVWCAKALYALTRGRRPHVAFTLAFAAFGVAAPLLSHAYGVGFFARVLNDRAAPVIAAVNLGQLVLGAAAAGGLLLSETRPG
ncbi:MAG: hypothetical protein QM723_26080 [Myxococcaceae bacterium]